MVLREGNELKIEGTYTFKASREKVWRLLLDPKIIAGCVPGCEELKEIGPDQYEAVTRGGAKGGSMGKVSIKEKRAPEHYVVSGKGLGNSTVTVGDVSIDLEESGEQTVVKYTTDAKVGGLLASLGQKMVGGMAKMMVDQFFKKVESFL